MTTQEKKAILIERIQNETSEDEVTRMYDEVLNRKSWDSECGQNILKLLLEKSQQQAKEGKTYSSDEIKEEVSKRIGSRKVIS